MRVACSAFLNTLRAGEIYFEVLDSCLLARKACQTGCSISMQCVANGRDGRISSYNWPSPSLPPDQRRQVLPRQGYARLFSTMYATLVPTAGEEEAEETANWEYGEDAKDLPVELGRAGIPLGAFSDALFAVTDNVGEEKLKQRRMHWLSCGSPHTCHRWWRRLRRVRYDFRWNLTQTKEIQKVRWVRVGVRASSRLEFPSR